MRIAIREKQRQEIEALEDPRQGEEWFERLPEEHCARMTREWRANLVDHAELRAGMVLSWIRDTLRVGGIYAVGDFCSAGGGVGTAVAAIPFGAFLGLLTVLLGAGRMTSAAIGMPTFLSWMWLSRGGIAPQHLFLMFLVGCACAYHGYLREDEHLA